MNNIELITDKLLKIINNLLETSHKKWPNRPEIINMIVKTIVEVEFKDTISDYIVYNGDYITYLHNHKQIIVFHNHHYIFPTYAYLKEIDIKFINGIPIYTDKTLKSKCTDFRKLMLIQLPKTIKQIQNQCTKKK